MATEWAYVQVKKGVLTKENEALLGSSTPVLRVMVKIYGSGIYYYSDKRLFGGLLAFYWGDCRKLSPLEVLAMQAEDENAP